MDICLGILFPLFIIFIATRKYLPGRQGGGYSKLEIINSKYFDLLLIHYPNGSVIDNHQDICDYGRHFRLNITLWKPNSGGEFKCDGSPLFSMPRIVLFRPDFQTHSVSKVNGIRLVLTIGCIFP